MSPLPSRHMSDRILGTQKSRSDSMFQKADPDHMLSSGTTYVRIFGARQTEGERASALLSGLTPRALRFRPFRASCTPSACGWGPDDFQGLAPRAARARPGLNPRRPKRPRRRDTTLPRPARIPQAISIARPPRPSAPATTAPAPRPVPRSGCCQGRRRRPGPRSPPRRPCL